MRRRLAAVVALTMVVAASCGARLDASQRGAALQTGGGAVASSAPSNVAEPASAGAAPEDSSGSTGSTGVDLVTPAAEGPAAAVPDTCTPAPGSTEVGITDTEIRIGNVSTLGGPVPGLSQTVVDGAQAYFAYRNQVFGGVCGRRLKMLTVDDRLDAAENRAQTEHLSEKVLGFAGYFSAVDDGGASVLAGTNIPDVGLSVTAARIALPNNFAPNPFDPTTDSNGQVPAYEHFVAAYGVSRGGVVWAAQAASRKKGQNFAADMRAAGLASVTTAEVPLTESSFAGVARQLADAKVDLVVTSLDINGVARLARAFADIDYHPTVACYGIQAYSQQLTALAGDAAEGAIVALPFNIAEDADNPAVATMVRWYRSVNPGADLDTFAIEGWAAAAMFTKALELAGSDPTRAKVLAALGTFHAFDADGLIAPADVAGKHPPTCFIVASLHDGRWSRTEPASGFLC